MPIIAKNLGGGHDNDAVHLSIASEINSISEKGTPVSADLIIIEDSEDSNNKKKVQIGNLPDEGEANTVSSQGSGTSIYYQKSGVDLQFNAIKSENNLLSVALDSETHDVEFTINESNFVLDGVTAQIDGINSDGGNFTFATTGEIILKPDNQNDTLKITYESSYISYSRVHLFSLSNTANSICIDAGVLPNNMLALRGGFIFLHGYTTIKDTLNMSSEAIVSLADPSDAQDAATKNYVDSNTIGDVVDDTTPQLGGDLDLNEKYIELNSSPDSDHTGNGLMVKMTYGESISLYDVLYLKSDGKLWKGDADAESTAKTALYLALEGGSADETKKVLKMGYARDDSWSWTVGGEIFLDTTTSGGMTQTRPSGSGDIVIRLGHAVSATVIEFTAGLGYVEVTA